MEVPQIKRGRHVSTRGEKCGYLRKCVESRADGRVSGEHKETLDPLVSLLLVFSAILG